MADAGGTVLSYVRGSVALGNTFGTAIPTPALKRIRVSTDQLALNVQTVESPELVAGYRVKRLIPVAVDAAGSITAPFLWGNFDDWLEALLFSTWQRTPQRFNAAADQEITDVAAATGVITILAALASDVNRTGTFGVGHLVRSSAFTAAGNNFLKRVTAASGTSLTVSITGLVNEAAPPAAARLKAVGIEAPAVGNIQTTTAGLASGSIAAITGTGVDFVALGVVAGMWLKMSDCPTAVNNGWYRALSVVAGRIECDRAPVGFITDTAAAAQVRLWLPDWIRDGTNPLIWFDIERSLSQLTVPEWHYFRSMVPSQLAITINAGSVLDAAMQFIGADRNIVTTRAAGFTVPTADALGALPRAGNAYDASNQVAQIAEAGTLLTDSVLSTTWTISNGLNGLRVVGRRGFGRLGRQEFRPSVTLNSYYDSKATLEKLELGTETSLHAILTDATAARAFVLALPAANLASGDIGGIQKGGQLQVPYAFGGIEKESLGCAVQLQRFEEYA